MKIRNKLFPLLVLAILIAAFSVVPGGLAQDKPFKVAAVAPSATNDLAFSQSMFDALTAIQKERGQDNFQFDFLDGVFNVDDAAKALRDWAASRDYNLIIAHGSQYGSILEELAPEFPDISFAWGTDVDTFGYDNVYAYEAASDEGGYINGFVAAGMTQSKVIGVIGPIEVGDAKLYVDGFKAGVEAYNQAQGDNVTVNVNYIQSFSDVALATEAAQTHIANGADILTGSAQMVVGPIGVAKERCANVAAADPCPILWFGTQSNQSDLGGRVVVMNQVYHWEVILDEIVTNIIDNQVLGGESYTLDLENGGLAMEINPAFFGDDANAMTTFEDAVNKLKDGIVSGDIEIVQPEATSTP